MYLAHFGLREYPFSLTPDTEFFFSSGIAKEALNTLLIAARTGEGFIKITGEVGTGKTMLCRKLIASLEPEFKVAYLPNPTLTPDGLLSELAIELGVVFDSADTPQPKMLRLIQDSLLALHAQGKRVAVCLDEVQAMAIDTLETLRLLTNLETEKRKLLQVVLFGQPEMEEKLDHPSIRQLKQRISFHYVLRPMAGDELDYYVQHRLTVAGYRGARLFTKPAIWQLNNCTQCVPRLVNIVAHKALLSAYGKGQRRVRRSDVLAAQGYTPTLATKGATLRLGLLVTLLIFSFVLLLLDRRVFQ